jgi:putative mRNA 3-end processing factor
VIGTHITLDSLEVLGHRIPKHKRVALNYGDVVAVDDQYKVSLEYAEHIPGSAQVIVEYNGTLVAYTGDFKDAGTKTKIIEQPHILIIDATYGNPRYVRESEDIIWTKFVELLKKLLVLGPVTIYAYYGKAQNAMLKLREMGIDAPLILSPTHWKLYKVLEKYGHIVNDVFLQGSPEAEEIRRTGWYIEFKHTASLSPANGLGSHIILTGRFAKTIMRMGTGNLWIVGVSGHADFNDLVYYVDSSRPEILIVDGYRSEYAQAFASYIRDNLNIEAIVLPP